MFEYTMTKIFLMPDRRPEKQAVQTQRREELIVLFLCSSFNYILQLLVVKLLTTNCSQLTLRFIKSKTKTILPPHYLMWFR